MSAVEAYRTSLAYRIASARVDVDDAEEALRKARAHLAQLEHAAQIAACSEGSRCAVCRVMGACK